jgi:selenide,water dikinase
MTGHRLPKSGVYAVRQGPRLATNLRQALVAGPLRAYEPQASTLALISIGDRYAVASYGRFAFKGAWVWRWKDYIDRRFMHRYRALSPGNDGHHTRA